MNLTQTVVQFQGLSLISAQPCNVCVYAGRILKVTPVQMSGHRACVVLGYCQLGAVYINHTVSYFTSSFYLKCLLYFCCCFSHVTKKTCYTEKRHAGIQLMLVCNYPKSHNLQLITCTLIW